MAQDTFEIPTDTTRKAWNTAFSILGKSKGLIIGLSVAIGSLGLALGGVTVLLTYIFMSLFVPDHMLMPMLPAMIIGFFGVGLAGMAIGFTLAGKNIKTLRPAEA